MKKSLPWHRRLAPNRLDLRRLILVLTICSALIPFANTFYAGYLVQRQQLIDNTLDGHYAYATKLAHACAPSNLKWIEECLPPQQYEGYRELKRNAPAGMMVTSGEHHGTLQSFRTLSETGIDIMQPDVGWCGGLTTLVEIAAIAKSRGQLVVPHGSSVYSHHAVITFTNTPFS